MRHATDRVFPGFYRRRRLWTWRVWAAAICGAVAGQTDTIVADPFFLSTRVCRTWSIPNSSLALCPVRARHLDVALRNAAFITGAWSAPADVTWVSRLLLAGFAKLVVAMRTADSSSVSPRAHKVASGLPSEAPRRGRDRQGAECGTTIVNEVCPFLPFPGPCGVFLTKRYCRGSALRAYRRRRAAVVARRFVPRFESLHRLRLPGVHSSGGRHSPSARLRRSAETRLGGGNVLTIIPERYRNAASLRIGEANRTKRFVPDGDQTHPEPVPIIDLRGSDLQWAGLQG